MKNEEEIVVVNVYFGTLHKTGTVLDIQWVEMEVIPQEIQVFDGRICNMMPFKGPEIDGVNHL